MKKWLLSLLAILVIAIASVYIFIPAKIAVTRSVPVSANQDGALRFLSSLSNWEKFWPATNYYFSIDKVKYNAIEITLADSKGYYEGSIFILPYQLDSFKLQWTCFLRSSNNPFTRIQNHFTAKKLAAGIDEILQHMAASLDNVETIYGIDVKKEKVQFQHFLSAKKRFQSLPFCQ